MRIIQSLLVVLAVSTSAWALPADNPSGLPNCKAVANDRYNTEYDKVEWTSDFHMGPVGGIWVTTSLGHKQVMSVWIRESESGTSAGTFSFIDMSTGISHYLRYYRPDGSSVGVTCKWTTEKK